MLFNSFDFLIFFPVVLVIFYLIPRKFKHIWLLAASYFFYMCWNPKYVVLLLSSTLMTYFCGIILENLKSSQKDQLWINRRKKTTVAFCIAFNLGILYFFKYLNFSTFLLNSVFDLLGIRIITPTFDILLPVGISFYTFQALGYTIDVYRDEIYAEKNFFRYALFVSFFPQLVAGPIERSKNLLKQLYTPAKLSFSNLLEGCFYILWGLFLKIVLADRIAVFVDTVYGDYNNYPSVFLLIATILFAVQIYCDFAGYSTIAVGAAKMLGIKLMKNFDAPYISTSVAEFWRKWHISLTSWFRDYLYIPLGGSRKGKIRKYINILSVFLVSGLWHGASLSFVVWGGLNGLYQILGDMLKPIRERICSCLHINCDRFAYKLVQVITTFILVDFAWIFFRAPSLRSSIEIARSILCTRNLKVLFDGSIYNCGLNYQNTILMLICILVLLVADLIKHSGRSLVGIVMRRAEWIQIMIIVGMTLCIVLFGIWGGNYDETQFIYFQF